MRHGLAAALFIAAVSPAAAQDVMAGRTVALRTCQGCHGIDGIATLPEAANLAGQDATYLTRQLTAFREGSREHEQMTLIAKMLNDQQIADVAAYYNAIKIEVQSIPGKPK